MKKLTERIAGTKYVRDLLAHPADLSAFKERPTPRLIAGLFLMAFSYVIGWPAVAAFAFLAVWMKEPAVAAIGPVCYGLSYVVFFVGAWMARAPHYLGVLGRYATGKLLRKILRLS